MAGTYKPTQSKRFFPGASISPERMAALDKFQVDPDHLVVDDIVYSTGRAFTRLLYTLLSIIESRWGKQAAREVAHELLYRRGKANIAKWFKGTTKATPESFAIFHDIVHALSGPDHVTITQYDDEKVVARRTVCLYYTGRPEGMEPYCSELEAGIVKAYTENIPGLVSVKLTDGIPKGAGYCEHVFTFQKT